MRTLRCWPRRRASRHRSKCAPTTFRHCPLRPSLTGPSREGGSLRAVGGSALPGPDTGASSSSGSTGPGALPWYPERSRGRGRPPGPLPKAAFVGGPRGPKRVSCPAPSLGTGPGAPWPGPEDCPVCPRGLGWDGPSPIPGRESPASGSGIVPIAWVPLFLGLCYWPEGKTDTQHSPPRPVNLSVVLPTTRQLCS